jgi:hypothetical protein
MPTKTKPKSLIPSPDPQVLAIKTRATKLLREADTIAHGVKDTVGFERAGLVVKDAVALRKDLKALPVYTELAKAKADIKTKEKLLKEVDKIIENAEDIIRDALSTYAARQRAIQEKQIESAMSKGKDEKAAVIAAKPFVPEVQGLSFTEHWHAEVENLHEFIVWVLSGPTAELENLLSPNLVTLNTLARAQKDALAIPGVKAVKETSSTIRG